jgi:hypothetical protein
MNIIVGYEKAWGAFLGAGSIGAATTLALSLVSLTGAVTVPDEAMIVAAVTGLVSAIFAAIGAYLPTNTEAKPAAEEMPLPPPLR